jgi:hypothetical protein
MGRPAINGVAMSSSERSRRRRDATKLHSAADAKLREGFWTPFNSSGVPTKSVLRPWAFGISHNSSPVSPGCAPCNETPHATKPVPLADATKLVGDPVTVSAPEIMPEYVRRLSAASQREWRDGVGLFSPLAGRVPR